MVSGKNIRRILCGAILNDVLIVTRTDDEARMIRREISEFVRFGLSPEINVRVHSEGVNVGGYEPIFVYDLKKWNNRDRLYPFVGVVIVTDKNISGIKNIAEGTKKRLLPVERSDTK